VGTGFDQYSSKNIFFIQEKSEFVFFAFPVRFPTIAISLNPANICHAQSAQIATG